MVTECPPIIVWILLQHWKIKKERNGKAAGHSLCIMYMAVKMPTAFSFAMIPMTLPKHRLCKHLCFAGFLLLRIMLNFNRMRSIKINWLLLIICMAFYSCTKVININLNDASPKIVIEGNITNVAGPYQVQITQTVNFSASNIFPAVPGAIVKITDTTISQTDSLIETTPGIYTTQTLLLGIPGHTYQLYVFVNGQTYTSLSTMPQLVQLDSITFQHTNRFGTIDIDPVANFQDPAGVANYYTFVQFVNNKRLKNTYVFNDRLSDGKYISQQIFSDSAYIHVGDTVLLQMNCLDESAYNYFNTLNQVTGGNNFQSASPSNPISNISNNALGYFSAAAITEKKRIAY